VFCFLDLIAIYYQAQRNDVSQIRNNHDKKYVTSQRFSGGPHLL